MSKIPKVVIPDNAVGFDKACGVVQAALAEKFSWLDHAFGKSQLLVTKKGRNEYKYPAIHFAKGSYLDMLPNQKFGNFCFFIIEDPQEIIDFIPHHLTKIESKFSIVFWFDLRTIQSNVKGREIEDLKMKILNALNTEIRFQDARLSVNSISERAENIYKEYSIREVNQQFLMQPYGGLRFTGTMTINELC